MVWKCVVTYVVMGVVMNVVTYVVMGVVTCVVMNVVTYVVMGVVMNVVTYVAKQQRNEHGMISFNQMKYSVTQMYRLILIGTSQWANFPRTFFSTDVSHKVRTDVRQVRTDFTNVRADVQEGP